MAPEAHVQISAFSNTLNCHKSNMKFFIVGCGAVGRAIAFNNRYTRFESREP